MRAEGEDRDCNTGRYVRAQTLETGAASGNGREMGRDDDLCRRIHS